MAQDTGTEYFVIEHVEDDVVEVEFASGLRGEWPRGWLGPDLAEGDGFRVERGALDGALRFVADERAARIVRERNKQTLLDFHDEHEA